MKKYFSRHRLKKDAPKKNRLFLHFLLGGIGILILVFLTPALRILWGPFGSFSRYIGSFWNSTHIILFQNEAEIRPSGGFISAIGVLEIKNGIPHIEIVDSYSIADPPEPVRSPQAIEDVFSSDPQYKGFLIRDANFSPDFPTNAKKIIEFLQYDSHFSRKKIDSVIAVNFRTVEDLLEIFGPIEDFSSENLFRSLQRETKDIDLHSTEDLETRKDGLGELANRLLRKIGYFGIPKALKQVSHSAEKKDVQMWFSDPVIQKIPRKKGWDGAMPLEMFYSVNIANLGAKKSDRYVYKQYFSDISVAVDGKMTEQFTIRFHHQGEENLFSGPGYYYVRIYRPSGTTLIGNADDWSQKTLVGQYEEFSKMVYLESSQVTDVSAGFQIPGPWTVGDRTFYWWTQPGSMDELMLTISHPGDPSFSAEGCDRQYHHENVLFCFSSLESDVTIDVRMTPDKLPPIIEDIFFDNPREISVRFSEAVSEEISGSSVMIRCKDKEYIAEQVFRNEEYPRDARIALTERADLNGQFCQLEWAGIRDEYENETTIKMTLPFRQK